MVILEENFKWHLEAFASELFIYSHRSWINQQTGPLWILLRPKRLKLSHVPQLGFFWGYWLQVPIPY